MPLERLPALLNAIIDDGYDMARVTASAEPASMPRHHTEYRINLLNQDGNRYWHIFDPQNVHRRRESLGR